jgi:predicted nucleic acid-binding protein
VIVVDASVWVSSLIAQDRFHQISRRWLQRYLASGDRLVAPMLLLAEVVGAVARLKADSQFGRDAVQELLSVPQLELVPHDAAFGEAAALLAADLRLRGPDAAYVAVAQQRRIPLITWDNEQGQRAATVVIVQTPQ